MRCWKENWINKGLNLKDEGKTLKEEKKWQCFACLLLTHHIPLRTHNLLMEIEWWKRICVWYKGKTRGLVFWHIVKLKESVILLFMDMQTLSNSPPLSHKILTNKKKLKVKFFSSFLLVLFQHIHFTRIMISWSHFMHYHSWDFFLPSYFPIQFFVCVSYSTRCVCIHRICLCLLLQ